jgi:two-component system, chemotaxis family, protein-glutamate methylesterase/glutaminase
VLPFVLLAGALRPLKQVGPSADVIDASTKDFASMGVPCMDFASLDFASMGHAMDYGKRSDVADSRNGSVSLTHGPLAPIRVLIADDSAVMRSELFRMLDSNPQIRVCGTARNGQEVVEKTKLLQPDVVTIDVDMPLLNGVEALKRIMRECPCPVIMFSSATREGAEITLEALSAGAFDYLPKVSSHRGENALKLQQELIEKIEAASHSWLARRRAPLPLSVHPPALRIGWPQRLRPIPRIIVLGTSTGGPQALQGLLPELPGDLPVAMIVVQHMPPGFTAPLAKRLDGLSRVKVCEAGHGQAVVPGTVYIAPAGRHTTLSRNSEARNSHQVSICLSYNPSGTVHKPSVDVTMLSVAEVFGNHTLGIILTGMGTDGLQGMTAIHDAGGLTMGQDEASSVVYGMPRCCAERGILQQVVPLSEVPRHILRAVHYVHPA